MTRLCLPPYVRLVPGDVEADEQRALSTLLVESFPSTDWLFDGAMERQVRLTRTRSAPREPNPRVSFGGGGIHHGLGNQLARMQPKALLVELMSRVPQITAGEQVPTPSNLFHIVKTMPLLPLTPATRARPAAHAPMS